MDEIFKDIEGYEGLYQVSNLGRVRSLKYGKTKILTPMKNKGYLQVNLCEDGKMKRLYVHRLVANAFLPNPRNYPVINHKDENPSNNVASNLEFCTQKYNTCYGTGLKRMVAKLVNGPCAKTVLQYDQQGNLVKTWPSAKEVKRQTGFHQGAICECCNGKRKSYKGYVWRFKI